MYFILFISAPMLNGKLVKFIEVDPIANGIQSIHVFARLQECNKIFNGHLDKNCH